MNHWHKYDKINCNSTNEICLLYKLCLSFLDQLHLWCVLDPDPNTHTHTQKKKKRKKKKKKVSLHLIFYYDSYVIRYQFRSRFAQWELGRVMVNFHTTPNYRFKRLIFPRYPLGFVWFVTSRYPQVVWPWKWPWPGSPHWKKKAGKRAYQHQNQKGNGAALGYRPGASFIGGHEWAQQSSKQTFLCADMC